MGKGYKGETCTEAIKAVIGPGEALTAAELFNRIRAQGAWTEDTIWQHLIAHVVNHPAARHHYAGFEPFLYLHEDGRYELFDPAIHPVVKYQQIDATAPESKIADQQSELGLDFTDKPLES
jgi:hypothetical protein